MANNYLQFSFAVPFTHEQAVFADELIGAHEMLTFGDTDDIQPEHMAILKEMKVERGDQTMNVETTVEADGTLGIWCEEWGNVEALVSLLQRVLAHFDLDMKIGFSWAEYCSKPRIGEFGGGAVVFDRNDAEWTSTSHWLIVKGVNI